MKNQWLPAFRMTLICLLLLNGGYTGIVWALAQITPLHGDAERITAANGQRYYTNIGQRFTRDNYFQGRPSAVGYNAAGSGGSNKGPSDPEYLATVRRRIDTFLVRNPAVSRSAVPAELVTASGSGLDPDLSPAAALVQVARIAAARHIPPHNVIALIEGQSSENAAGLGPQRVNVLRLNLALDALR